MENYLNITVDTTVPLITLYAPDTIDRSQIQQITVQCSEDISSYLAYFMDSERTKHDLQLTIQGNQLIGDVDLKAASIGKGVLFVYVTDSALNTSKTSRKQVSILDSPAIGIKDIEIYIDTVSMILSAEKVVPGE